ncbi:MAG: hypothetical protein R2719_01235 [Micropruina sp.]
MTDYWDARSADYDATHEVADRAWRPVLEGWSATTATCGSWTSPPAPG